MLRSLPNVQVSYYNNLTASANPTYSGWLFSALPNTQGIGVPCYSVLCVPACICQCIDTATCGLPFAARGRVLRRYRRCGLRLWPRPASTAYRASLRSLSVRAVVSVCTRLVRLTTDDRADGHESGSVAEQQLDQLAGRGGRAEETECRRIFGSVEQIRSTRVRLAHTCRHDVCVQRGSGVAQ